ncbi:MAG TPA: 3-phosphoshikimate 1-carboxyvinyltransferase [Longimicrobiales bacterium]|nr:3-phosphoshikimate 1-carboxyvinyltransferase [Longimicrobiales bacterium]
MTDSERAPLELEVPGDKSITHRALMLAALADGESRLSGALPAEDPRSTAAVLRALGGAVPDLPPDGGEIRVAGRGLHGLAASSRVLDCGNSGTTARLMLGILAGYPFEAELTGDASLRSRPMRRVTEPLSAMGASFVERGEPDRLPIRIRGGSLRPLAYESAKASAQVKSAILLAGLVGDTDVEVREPLLSRDHTERMLRAMGAAVLSDRLDGRHVARLTPVERLEPLDLRIPGDFSSAAFVAAMALLGGRSVHVRGVGMNPGRTGLLAVLRRMGAGLVVDNAADRSGEPVADLHAGPTPLRATSVGADEIPALVDEVPIIAVLAARADGETRITGAGELRVKESDRIAALVSNLRRLGVEAEELPDGLVVRGTDAPLAGPVRTHADHRIAMAFGVLGALPGNEIVVDDPDCVAVSFPGFWDVLRRATEGRRR